MKEFFKKYELSKKGKIILMMIIILILGIIFYFIMSKGKNIESLSLDIVEKNQGSIIYDPINGNSLRLEIAKKAQLEVKISPDNHKKVEIEYFVDDENIAYVNDNNMIVGKKEGKTRVYAKTKDGKVISNYIDVVITY